MDWMGNGKTYANYFERQARALEAVGVRNANDLFTAQLQPDVAEAAARAVSLELMGAGINRQEIEDPELGVTYILLHPQYRATFADVYHWGEYHHIYKIPFDHPRWGFILGTERQRFIRDQRYFVDLSKPKTDEGQPKFAVMGTAGKIEWQSSEYRFDHCQCVAVLIFPGEFGPRWLTDDESQSLNKELEGSGLVAKYVHQWALPQELRMALFAHGLQIAGEADLPESLRNRENWFPKTYVDDGKNGIRLLGSEGGSYPQEVRDCGGYVLGKPIQAVESQATQEAG